MWRILKHQYVLPFVGIYAPEDEMEPRYFLVSPYMMNGTLAEWRKKANPSITEIQERVGSKFHPSTFR
jgi:hypothetical protein